MDCSHVEDVKGGGRNQPPRSCRQGPSPGLSSWFESLSSKTLSPPEGLEEENVEVGEMGGWDDDHEEIIKEISLINGKQFTNFREMYFNVECSTAHPVGGAPSMVRPDTRSSETGLTGRIR